ncbi:GNAT family N-acetyltransferase [Steroidobacter cummioxidans]|uniref:GNAT family N-acetyltransferase n=1 Tax=Steroidobacter cummioxidans TaxID=1803913 RepID=UPI0019D48489|nr:GNAT family N-acetyltransferase [Steroidobacter cummioxidans]
MPKLPAIGVQPPERLGAHHDLTHFKSGKHESLDFWLRTRALASEGLSARTYVICSSEPHDRVVGYYAISTAMAHRSGLPTAKLRRGMPDEVPLLLLGRLAIDAGFQKRGLGTDLLIDALRRCLIAADTAGASAVITHAIDNDALAFYERHGFIPCPLGERTLVMPMETIRALVG